jgi:hypothetical protein
LCLEGLQQASPENRRDKVSAFDNCFVFSGVPINIVALLAAVSFWVWWKERQRLKATDQQPKKKESP